MKPVQVKIFLLKEGLSLAEIARGVKTKKQSEESIRTMLSHMVHGHRFYPALAEIVEERYGLRFARPKTNGAARGKAA